jgi:hypothetical protein
MAKIRLFPVEAREVHQKGFIEVFKKANDIEVVSVCANCEDTSGDRTC